MRAASVLLASVACAYAASTDISSRSVNVWTNGCTLAPTVCASIASMSPFGFPNIGGFQTSTTNSSSGSVQSDTLVAMVTTMGLPATWLAYYSVASQWQFSLDWSKMMTNWNVQSAASFSAATYATGWAIPRLIEFADVNNNQQYDPDVDTIASTYEFADASTLFPRAWMPMVQTQSTVIADSGENATLYSFNATTKDGVVSIQWNMCTAAYTFPNGGGAIVSPNNTKIDLQIVNYSYTHPGTLLAVETVLSGLQAVVDSSGNSQQGINLGALGRVDWVTTASASFHNDASIQVAASKMTSISASDVGSSLFAAAVVPQAGVTFNRVYFTFNQVQPAFVYWDPSVGYGMPALGPNGTATTALIVSIVIVGALVAAGLGIYWQRDKVRQVACVQNTPCLRSMFSVNSEYIAMDDAKTASSSV